MKQIILIISIVTLSLSSQAQMTIKNNLSFPIRVCIGWYQTQKDWSGFVSKGWYNIYPGETVSSGLSFTSDDDYFFYYVEGKTNGFKMINGTLRLLVNTSSNFTVKNANLSYVEDENKGVLTWKKFTRRNVHFKLLQERKYTFIVNLNDITN